MTALPIARRVGGAGRHKPAWLPVAIIAMAAIQVAASLSLATANGQEIRTLVVELTAVVIVGALAYSAVGALIIRHDPEHTIGWLFCVAGLGNGFFAWSSEYARFALITRSDSLPAAETLYWLNLWAWVPVQALLLILLPLLFPTGHLLSRRWRAVVWLGMASALTLSVVLAFGPKNDSLIPELENPYAIEPAAPLLGGLMVVANVGLVASLAAAVASFVTRYRRSKGAERAQLQWFGFGVALLITGFLVSAGLFLSGLDPTRGVLGATLLLALFPALPATTGVAILRYRLFDIDLVINRLLVYGILTGCLVMVYAGVVIYLGAALHAHGNPLVSLVGTGVVAVLFAPLRQRVQRAIDRLMYGERDDPYGVLSRLGRQLEATIEPSSALPVLVETVRSALKLPYAVILLETDGELRIVAQAGSPRPTELHLPIVYGGTKIGELGLAPRRTNETFSAADRHLLEELARQAGAVAQAARLTSELERSRRRIVEAREDARRRLGSDLHDGLGHRLAALLRRGEAAAHLVESDPDGAKRALGELTDQVRTVVGEVRSLAHALRPPELDLLGLGAALRERAGLDGDLYVSVDAPDLVDGLPIAVESAVYYIVNEALANTHRHSGASECRIRLDIDGSPRTARLEVRDNGRGMDQANKHQGLGLRSMRDRTEELDGMFEAGNGPDGGFLVRAWIPIEEPHRAKLQRSPK